MPHPAARPVLAAALFLAAATGTLLALRPTPQEEPTETSGAGDTFQPGLLLFHRFDTREPLRFQVSVELIARPAEGEAARWILETDLRVDAVEANPAGDSRLRLTIGPGTLTAGGRSEAFAPFVQMTTTGIRG